MKRLFVLIGPVALIALWGIISLQGVIDPFLLPGPITTFTQLIELTINGSLVVDLLATLERLAYSLSIALVIGVPLGLALGSARSLYRSFEFIIDFFRSMPATALFPMFMLIFGIGDTAKVAATAFAATLIILFNTAYGVMQTKKSRILAARLMGASRMQIFRLILIWESLPQTFIGIRSAASISLAIVIVTEMFLGTNVGLGRRIMDSQTTYDIPAMYAAIFVAGVTGYLLNAGLAALQSKLLHWSEK